MGMFSWLCRGCGHPLLAPRATSAVNRWMSDAVVLTKKRVIEGGYDGYGRVDGRELSARPCCYHRACWIDAGRPGYSGPSKGAPDQGWFFDAGAHDLPEPVAPR